MPARLPLIVTTSGKLMRRGADAEGEALAKRLGVPFVSNQRSVPLTTLLEQAERVLAWRGDGITLTDGTDTARWTPGMAELRIRRIDDAIQQPDHVLVAGEVKEGDALLDCTLGRGHDALVMARAVGERGRVVALEKSLPLFAWTSAGLERRGPSPRSCTVECVHADALEYLRAQPTRSFDCVFFDPMFDRKVLSEAGFDVVRRNADDAPITEAHVAEARRVARRWVVVKAAPQSPVLWKLGLTVVPFRRSADLRFGRVAAL